MTISVSPILGRTLAVGAVALASLVAWTGETVAQTAPDPALVGQVPAAFASTCTGTNVEGAEAAIACSVPEIASVTYARFPTPELADAHYDEQIGKDGRDTQTDCADWFDSESPYHTAAGGQGRVSCTTGRRESSLSWIDGAVVATATVTGDDGTQLYEWWKELVGRSFTATQKELLADLPAGLSRSMCQDNGENSLKCWPPFSVKDVYVIYYTKYPDARSLKDAYAGVLSDADLDRNLPPPNDRGTSCTYETWWGPVRDGATNKKLGRIACFEEEVATAMVWTRDDAHVLTKAVGYRPKDLWRYFQKYAGPIKGANRG